MHAASSPLNKWDFYEAVLFRASLELLLWRRSVTTLRVDHDVATPVQKHCAAGLLAVSKSIAVALRRELARRVLTYQQQVICFFLPTLGYEFSRLAHRSV